ncbi:betaine-aldehyde dehydrogenase [Ralstonia sp. 25mfcol4.1]|uniref:aldehyde dehydrogenase family protein n=1 Tax=Ralstonia sp. 25mfcol4.1 TaxID=1761899 RepID=UPI0003FB60B9|nr:aldehyde dehydrogenase family protein [Ralstonia sp. 25mfcol4.1]SDP77600.1 betaine-aldehyde dehydrogenase [Ralstonia sp. 25mfcol4.1]
MEAHGINRLDQAYINGKWVRVDGKRIDLTNPATEQIYGTLTCGGEAEIDMAVAAARAAFQEYSRTSLEFRASLLDRIAEVYERRLQDVAQAITVEMGAPLQKLSMVAQAPVGLIHFRTAAALTRQHAFETQLTSSKVVKEPIGVCALITPWNWPMNQVACKVAPALAAGCTVVLKPSQNAPLSAAIFAEILEEAGVPQGVFNMIQGEGSRLGTTLAAHPLVDMVSLTGSTTAGAQVTKAAADSIKRVSLELGGKSANIILDDADLRAAVTHGVHHMMSNSGQTCTAPSRMLVPAHRFEEALEIAKSACSQLVVGDPLSEETTVGPMANQRQYSKVREMIQAGLDEGASLVAGGLAPVLGQDRGYFVGPTIFATADNRSRIAQEEIFGPVLVMLPYRSEDEAVNMANDSIYGLSGYVFGGDIRSAERVARRMRTGMVHLNGAGFDPTAPFGGYKQSGNGREWGAAGIDEFLETKSIFGAMG